MPVTAGGRAETMVNNLLRAQSSNYRCRVEENAVVTSGNLDGLKGRLVAWTEARPDRSGSFSGRVVKALVGARHFDAMSTEIKENKQSSIDYALRGLVEEMSGGIEGECQSEIKQSVAQLRQGRRFEGRQIFNLAEQIMLRNNETKEEKASRSKSLDGVLTGEPTALMKKLNEREREVAVMALVHRYTPEQALSKTSPHLAHSGVVLDRIQAVVEEKKWMDELQQKAYKEFESAHTSAQHGPRANDRKAAVIRGHSDYLGIDSSAAIDNVEESGPDKSDLAPGELSAEHVSKYYTEASREIRDAGVLLNYNMNRYVDVLMSMDGKRSGNEFVRDMEELLRRVNNKSAGMDPHSEERAGLYELGSSLGAEITALNTVLSGADVSDRVEDIQALMGRARAALEAPTQAKEPEAPSQYRRISPADKQEARRQKAELTEQRNRNLFDKVAAQLKSLGDGSDDDAYSDLAARYKVFDKIRPFTPAMQKFLEQVEQTVDEIRNEPSGSNTTAETEQRLKDLRSELARILDDFHDPTPV